MRLKIPINMSYVRTRFREKSQNLDLISPASRYTVTRVVHNKNSSVLDTGRRPETGDKIR